MNIDLKATRVEKKCSQCKDKKLAKFSAIQDKHDIPVHVCQDCADNLMQKGWLIVSYNQGSS